MPAVDDLTPDEYQALADFRYRIRLFLHFSELAAKQAGLQPQQHQLLLATVALAAEDRPAIAHLAEYLQLRHHSTVELVDRSERAGLIERVRSQHDRRQVFIRVTSQGREVLARLSVSHREELRRAAPDLVRALQQIANDTHE